MEQPVFFSNILISFIYFLLVKFIILINATIVWYTTAAVKQHVNCQNCSYDSKTNMKREENKCLIRIKENCVILAHKQKIRFGQSGINLQTIWPDKKWQLFCCSRFTAIPFKVSSHQANVSFGSRSDESNDSTLLKLTMTFFTSGFHVLYWPPGRFFPPSAELKMGPDVVSLYIT